MALIGMTRNLSADYAHMNILSNMLSPGFTDTEWAKNISSEKRKHIEQKIPVGRLATAQEIAQAALWLLSPLNTYITGQNIFIDGGVTKSHQF